LRKGCPRLNTRPVYTKFGTPSPKLQYFDVTKSHEI
jgi:hypothetical protein